MSGNHHKPGDAWQLTAKGKNCWVILLRCKGCGKGFEVGQWVVQATVTPKRVYSNAEHGYARIRHIECFVDAHGNQLVEKP